MLRPREEGAGWPPQGWQWQQQRGPGGEQLGAGKLGEVQDSLLVALRQVHTGELESKQGSAMAALASAIVKIHEVGELEMRLATLEEKAQAGG